MLHFLWYLVVGFVVGLIARAVLPGVDRMGLIATTLVGIVGSVIGRFMGVSSASRAQLEISCRRILDVRGGRGRPPAPPAHAPLAS